MVTVEQTRELCSSEQVFSRGRRIYKENKIREFIPYTHSIEKDSYIRAEVEGSYGNSYTVGLEIDSYGRVQTSCECPAAHEYNGICKHQVAVLLRYIDEVQMRVNKQLKIQQEMGYDYGNDILSYYEHESIREINNEVIEEPITVYPKLCKDYRGGFELGISVGNKKPYVVKDLYEFAKNVLEEEQFAYGKNLAFVHSLENFDVGSRKLVNFIIDKIVEYSIMLEHLNSYTRFAKPSKKTLAMPPKTFDEFFDLLEGTEVEGEDKQSKVYLSKEKPQIAFEMVEKEKSFILKSNIKEYQLIQHPHRHYLYMQDKIYKCEENFAKIVFPLLEAMSALEDDRGESCLLFDEKGIKRFALIVLPKLTKYVKVTMSEEILEKYAPIPLEISFYLDRDKQSNIIGYCTFAYGDQEINPYNHEESNKIDTARDIEKESLFNKLLDKYEFRTSKGKLYLSEDEQIYRFLTEGVQEFLNISQMHITDALKKMTLTKPPIGGIGIKLVNNLLEVSFENIQMAADEIEAILGAYTVKKKYYRLKDGSFADLTSPAVEEMSHIMEGLNLTFKDLQNGEVSIQKYRALYLDQILKKNESMAIDRDKYFKKLIRDMKSVEDADYEVPSTLKNILRGYQKTGYRWLKTMAAHGFGGILADDMGLGKTLQVITLILSEQTSLERTGLEQTSLKQDGLDRGSSDQASLAEDKFKMPSLVVSPTSLVLNWQKEIEKFAPSLKVLVLNGDAENRKSLIESIQGYDVAITSYDLLKRDIEHYETLHFKYCIADEAHYIKNPNTQNAKALKSLESEVRFALTGTPIENGLAELWSIFDFIMPGYLFSYGQFKNKFETPIVKQQSEQAIKRLQKMSAPFILRRLKKDVLKELPQKTEMVIYNSMEKEQKAIYKAQLAQFKQELDVEMRENGLNKSQIKVLSLITRLRQLCCHPSLYLQDYKGESSKLKQCIEIITDSIEAGHKILLFSQFTSMLDLIAKELEKEKINYYMLTGQTKAEKRLQLVEDFNSNQVPVFLISLKAGGTGLNLTGADIVIHYDPWWNISSQNQATDRAYRIGQTSHVQVFKMITQNTIEEKIKELQDKKIGLTESVLTEGESFISKMTEEDIRGLFEID